MADYENFLIIFAYILILNFFNKLVFLKIYRFMGFTNTELAAFFRWHTTFDNDSSFFS